MSGRMIEISATDGGTFSAYLATPEGGRGPGLVLLQEIFGVNRHMRMVADLWAEEGYTVVVPDLFWRLKPGIDLGYGDDDRAAAMAYRRDFDQDLGLADIAATVGAMRAMDAVVGKVGALGFCLGGRLAYLAAAHAGVDCAVSYYGVGIETLLADAPVNVPLMLHFGAEDGLTPPAAVAAIQTAFADRDDVQIYVYPGLNHGFNCDERGSYDKTGSKLAHSRSLALMRGAMGPHFDLSGLWDAHCACEFGTRDVDATMATMVAQPYVNHIPTMTGGVGYRDLYRFYKHHFIPKTPADTKLTPVSRTVGVDRLVDELVFSFTHDMVIDWMLPGVAPTGRFVEVPLVAIVCFRGGKLYHEHIYWDQASVLVQIGLLDPKLLPIAGAATAAKLVDESLASNSLMIRWAESEAAG